MSKSKSTVDAKLKTLIQRGELVLNRRMCKADYQALAAKLDCTPKYAQWIVAIYRRAYDQKVSGKK